MILVNFLDFEFLKNEHEFTETGRLNFNNKKLNDYSHPMVMPTEKYLSKRYVLEEWLFEMIKIGLT